MAKKSAEKTCSEFAENIIHNSVTINPFVPNAPFLYPLKKSENLKVFRCFQGVQKGYIGNKWVNLTLLPQLRTNFLRNEYIHKKNWKIG